MASKQDLKKVKEIQTLKAGDMVNRARVDLNIFYYINQTATGLVRAGISELIDL